LFTVFVAGMATYDGVVDLTDLPSTSAAATSTSPEGATGPPR
jgi:hypothetical protein